MLVTFGKLGRRRYVMSVAGAPGPDLATRQGPGYDDELPHDLVHFVVERAAGLEHGIFGQLASGDSTGLFEPADPAEGVRLRRRRRRRVATMAQRRDTARSELLASICPVLWRERTGRLSERPAWFARVSAEELSDPAIDHAVAALDEVAASWTILPEGGELTLTWTLPAAGGRRRRREP